MTATISHGSRLDAEQEGYKQSLGRRQVQMIAIGGAIGTGLFLGSASRLHSTGPALVLRYAFVGLLAGMAAVLYVATQMPWIAFLWHNLIGAVLVVAVGMAISYTQRQPIHRGDSGVASQS